VINELNYRVQTTKDLECTVLVLHQSDKKKENVKLLWNYRKGEGNITVYYREMSK
jgi:hypothetical protein